MKGKGKKMTPMMKDNMMDKKMLGSKKPTMTVSVAITKTKPKKY